MSASQFNSLLFEAGLRLDYNDMLKCYHFFDIPSYGYLTRQSYIFFMILSDYEIDLIIEKIKYKMINLNNNNKTISNTNNNENTNIPGISSNETLKNGTIISQTNININLNNTNNNRKNKTINNISNNKFYLEIFNIIKNNNNITYLTHNNITNFIHEKLDIYLTNDELTKIIAIIDRQNDDIIDFNDFIDFISLNNNNSLNNILNNNNNSIILMKKSQRLYYLINLIRNYFIQNISNLSNNSNNTQNNTQNISLINDNLWYELKKRYEYITSKKFNNYLSIIDIITLLSKLGYIISINESYELILMIIPHKTNGKIQNIDLLNFIKSNCRNYGELLNIIKDEYLKTIYSKFIIL